MVMINNVLISHVPKIMHADFHSTSLDSTTVAIPLPGGPGRSMVTISKALHLKMKLGDTMRLTLYANRTLNRKEVEIKVGQLEVRVSDHLDAQCHSRRVTTGFDHVCALAGTSSPPLARRAPQNHCQVSTQEGPIRRRRGGGRRRRLAGGTVNAQARAVVMR